MQEEKVWPENVFLEERKGKQAKINPLTPCLKGAGSSYGCKTVGIAREKVHKHISQPLIPHIYHFSHNRNMRPRNFTLKAFFCVKIEKNLHLDDFV